MSRKKNKAARTGECSGCGVRKWLQNVPLKLCSGCNRARKRAADPDLQRQEAAARKREEKALKPTASSYAKANASDEADDEREQLYLRDWPVGKPLPSHYRPARKYPCPSCRRVTWKASQACILIKLERTIAYLRCRVCGEAHTLPVRRED